MTGRPPAGRFIRGAAQDRQTADSASTSDLRLQSSQGSLRPRQLTFVICNRSETNVCKISARPTHEKFQLFQSGRTGMDYRTERIWKFFIFYFRMPDSPVANDHYHSILHTFCFSCCSAIIFLSGNEKVRVVFS